MLEKYSVMPIIRGHISTMIPYGRSELSWREMTFFFAIPLVSPVVQGILQLHLTEGLVSTIVAAGSIFAGLLLNLLVLLYSIASQPIGSEDPSRGNERKLIQQTFYNISYSILLCAALVLFALIATTKIPVLARPSEFVVYYAGAQLFISIAQILKRCHKLLEFRISSRSSEVRLDTIGKRWPETSST